MEGKAMLFKEFGGVDAFRSVRHADIDEIVAVVRTRTRIRWHQPRTSPRRAASRSRSG
jgi:hypothetical protein